MGRRQRTVLALAILAWTAGSGDRLEAVMEHLTLAERVLSADVIVVGTVVAQEASLARVRGLPMIHTTVRLRVEQRLKGGAEEPTPSEELLIRVPGGEVGERSMTVSDTPRFADSARVVVFLRQRGELCQLIHGSRGTYTILTDPRTGDNIVRDAFGGPMPPDDLDALNLADMAAETVGLPRFLRQLQIVIHELA